MVLPLLVSWEDLKGPNSSASSLGLPPTLAHTIAAGLYPSPFLRVTPFCLAYPLSSTKQTQKPGKPSNPSSLTRKCPSEGACQTQPDPGSVEQSRIRYPCDSAPSTQEGGRDFRTGKMRKGPIAFSEEGHHSWGPGHLYMAVWALNEDQCDSRED